MQTRRPRQDQRFSFIGTGSTYIDLGDNFDKDVTDAFSVSYWAKPASIAGTQNVIDKHNAGSPFNGWVIAHEAGLPSFYLIDSATRIYERKSTSTILNTQNWQHIVWTFDGSNTSAGIKCYINGVQIITTLVVDTGPLGSTLTAISLRFGANSSGTAGFVGRLHDVIVHNAALTPQQVWDLYFSGAAVSVQGRWTFADGPGTVLTASVGGVNGTVSLDSAWSTDTPVKRTMKVTSMAGSIVQNGSTGWVNLGNNFNKAYNDAFSVSMWVKGATGSNKQIFGKRSFPNPGWMIIWNDTSLLTDCISFAMTTGVVSIGVRTQGIIRRGVWQHIVITYDGSGTASGIKVYIDGHKSLATTTVDNLAGGVTTNALNAAIGCDAAGASVFDGAVTHVRIHNVTLTADQVMDLYCDDVAVSVQAEWLMTDGAGTTLTASVGGVNGTINTPVWRTDTPKKSRSATSPRTVASARPASIRLLSIGDSITHGYNSRSYRPYLIDLLKRQFIDTIGTQSGNSYNTETLLKHEGRDGWTVSQFNTIFASTPPEPCDIAIINLGTNSIGGPGAAQDLTATQWRDQMLTLLSFVEPVTTRRVIIDVLTDGYPSGGAGSWTAAQLTRAAEYAAIASTLSSSKTRVSFVVRNGFNATTMTQQPTDPTHPNELGNMTRALLLYNDGVANGDWY